MDWALLRTICGEREEGGRGRMGKRSKERGGVGGVGGRGESRRVGMERDQGGGEKK